MYDTNAVDSTARYRKAVDYISNFQFHGFKLGLERIQAITQALNEPHKRYPCIHVAGTNGKGSVCTFLESILMRSGFKVGLYTSPHLVRLEERFRINGSFIHPKRLTDLIFRIKELVDAGHELSYFEYTTAISMLWFAEEGVDLAIFETGLGGRLDATNIIHPMVAVITSISLDHQAFLGQSIGEIAREKAGIVKRNCLVVNGARHPEAEHSIERRAHEVGAHLVSLGRDFGFEPTAQQEMNFFTGEMTLNGLSLGLLGRHQMENASLAIMACLLLNTHFGLSIPPEAIRDGLKEAKWPGRGEIIEAPQGHIILDGAHNRAGIEALRHLLDDTSQRLHALPKVLLWAMSDEGGDKDFAYLLGLIAHEFQDIILTEPPGPRRPVTIGQWKQSIRASNVQYEKDWVKALSKALSLLGPGYLMLVSGSLYLVGACRESLIKNFHTIK